MPKTTRNNSANSTAENSAHRHGTPNASSPIKQLDRSLGLFSVVGISIGAMLGSGIFVLPGLAAAKTGPSVWLAYVIAGACALPAALSKAELATSMPASGGSFIYIDRAFGPMVGTISGLGLWLSLLLKGSFALVGFGAYLSVFTHVPLKLVAIGMLVGVIAVNLVGVKNVGKIQIALVLVALGSLAVLVVMGLPTVDWAVFEGPQLRHGFTGLLETVGFVFVAYAGVTKAAAVAGEVRDPERNLPIGILVSLFIVIIVYALVVFVMSGNIRMEDFVDTEMPVYLLADAVGGPIIGILGAGLGVLTMSSMANAGLLASSRFPFAMSRNSVLPEVFSFVHPRFLTPVVSIIATGAAMAIVILLLDVERLAKLASAFVITIFIVENLAVIILRESSAQWYAPSYKSPLYPLTQIIGVFSGLVLLALMGVLAVIGLVAVIFPGMLLYFFYGRKRARRMGEFGKIGSRRDLSDQSQHHGDSSASIPLSQAPVLVSLFGKERSPETIVEMGIALAGKRNLVVQHITEIQENYVVEPKLGVGPKLHSLKRRLRAMSQDRKVRISLKTVATRDPAKTVLYESDVLGTQYLVFAWDGRAHLGWLLRDPHAWLFSHVRCNLALFKDAGVRYIKKVIVYADPGPHDVLVVRTADQLAKQFDADITFVRYVPDNVPAPLFQSQVDYVDVLRHLCQRPSEIRILRGSSLLSAISHESAYHDLLVLGAPPESGIRGLLLKSTEDRITQVAACSVLRLRTPRVQTHTAYTSQRETSPDEPNPVLRYMVSELIETGLSYRKKGALFRNFSQRLSREISGVSAQNIERALWNREITQNTAVGRGLALPHATIDQCSKTFLALFTTAEPIDYGAADGKKVDVFMITVGPPCERQIHLELLAAVARLVVETNLLDRVRQARNAADVLQAIGDTLGESKGSQ